MVRCLKPFLTIGVWGAVCFPAWAAGGVEKLAAPGEQVRGPSITAVSSARADGTSVTVPTTPWPEGVLELLNDPLRTYGWKRWFSEFPNDVESFEFAAQTPREVEHLVRKFTAIESPALRMVLVPEAGRTRTPAGDRGTTVVVEFQIGNQAVVDHWLKHQAARAGFRIDPVACPPTLVLYAGHPSVNLTKLDIPLAVEVAADLERRGETAPRDEAVVRLVERFAEAHRARRVAAGLAGKQQN